MSDPVADFLAREQDLMNEIDGGSATNVPPAAPVQNAADDFDDFTSVGDSTAAVPVVTEPVGDNQEPSFEMPLVNGTGSVHDSSKSASPAPAPVPRIEAENIRRWREQQKVILEKKDEAEEKKKQELRTAAKKELDEWYRQRDATLKSTQEANRKTEEAHKAAFAKEQADGAQWDEIAKMVDSKAAKGGKDVTRLKSLLLHLKEHTKKSTSSVSENNGNSSEA